MEEIIERAAGRDTTLTAYFKANAQHPQARTILYQDFPAKFRWNVKTHKWTPRARGLAIGRMYFVSVKAGERFYLRLLLTAIKGATSFQDLSTVDGVVYPTFRQACLARGLLDDDNEWHLCLTEGRAMATGYQLRMLFVIILCECNPLNPLELWEQHKHYICDDLHHFLHHHNHPDPSQEDVLDYGLYLIDKLLNATNKSLRDWPDMPQVQQDWGHIAGNRLIAEQLNYDREEQVQLGAERTHSLNHDQHQAFDNIVHAVNTHSGQIFFLHGPGGTGKTYLYNTLCYHLCGQGKIVLCVASSGIAALLLNGGRTSHSMFKIPIQIHDTSTCSISKSSDLAEMIRHTDLVIWDEAPMQHRHIHEAVDRSFKDICNSQAPFGGISIVFGGDFQQILPVIIKGSRPDIVGACMQRSPLWTTIRILHLKENMRLIQGVEEQNFAQWQLDVGHGQHTTPDGNIQLPPHFLLPENSLSALITYIYPTINQLPTPSPEHFSSRAILSSRNTDVDDINQKILDLFPGEEVTCSSVDSVLNNNPDAGQGELMYPIEYLNSINCSGLPLAHLKLKLGAPVMVLRNINTAEGVCNGSRGIVTQLGRRVIQIRLITGDKAGTCVLIPRLKLTPSETQVPFDFQRQQFPLRLCFAMTINKAQGQSLKHVGLDLRTPIFTHGQFYVAISRVTSVHNIKAIWDPKVDNAFTKNIVYPEVLLN